MERSYKVTGTIMPRSRPITLPDMPVTIPPAEKDETAPRRRGLRADGTVRVCEKGAWAAMEAPFYAEGAGAGVALGAMAAGATAEEAARIACHLVDGRRGPVVVVRLREERA